jgi:hypothetical protein
VYCRKLPSVLTLLPSNLVNHTIALQMSVGPVCNLVHKELDFSVVCMLDATLIGSRNEGDAFQNMQGLTGLL